ncbi:unnamed protein product [Clavelina lepadiformis]|uniref:Secreted protein n=1 Tax=Clavelina lepadiformis TaxID=159417 RepID=A0ABP0G4V0_CLALP
MASVIHGIACQSLPVFSFTLCLPILRELYTAVQCIYYCSEVGQPLKFRCHVPIFHYNCRMSLPRSRCQPKFRGGLFLWFFGGIAQGFPNFFARDPFQISEVFRDPLRLN